MEYLSIQEINSIQEDIKQEMELPLSNKSVVFKPNLLQWQFFNDCLNTLFNSGMLSKFSSLDNSHKAQLKFEVEDSLRKFYLKPERHLNFVFQIIHKKELKNIFDNDSDSYPEIESL